MTTPTQVEYGSHKVNGGPAQNGNGSQARNGGHAWDPAKLADLKAAAANLNDLIEVRKATDNRHRYMTYRIDSEDMAGGTMAQQMPEVTRAAETRMREILLDAYQQAVPQHIRDWAASVPGLGDGLLFPRMIAIIGDPRTATPLLPIAKGDKGTGARSQPAGDPYPRTLRQLWQYAGCGDPDRLPREELLGRKPSQADVLAAGKRTELRPLLHTFTSGLLRAHTRSPAIAQSRYWRLFEQRRLDTQERRHQRTCRNRARPPAKPNGCGTVLHPEWGEPGSLWRPGHSLMDAHRYVQKAFLADLWRVSG